MTERRAREDRDDREREERERGERRSPHDHAPDHLGARKPAARSFVCAALPRSPLTKARAAARCGLDFTTATAYWTMGCALHRIPIVATFPRTDLASVR